MKNLFAAASYSFNNFYNNLNTQGQMIFSIIMLLIIVLCAILLVQTFNAYGTLSDLKKQKKELTQEYNDQLELSDELKEKEDYVKTDEYIEEMARKMGLVYPDEVIFKPED